MTTQRSSLQVQLLTVERVSREACGSDAILTALVRVGDASRTAVFSANVERGRYVPATVDPTEWLDEHLVAAAGLPLAERLGLLVLLAAFEADELVEDVRRAREALHPPRVPYSAPRERRWSVPGGVFSFCVRVLRALDAIGCRGGLREWVRAQAASRVEVLS